MAIIIANVCGNDCGDFMLINDFFKTGCRTDYLILKRSRDPY